MFVLGSEVTIGGFKFKGVTEGRVTRSIRSIADSCVIKLPSVGRVKRKSGAIDDKKALSWLFNEGDKVTVNLGYNGKLKREFEGFVKHVNPEVPMAIECEGYVRQLRLNKNIKGFYAETTAKKLLELAVKGTDVTIDCRADMPIHNITLDNASGADIVNEIMKIGQNIITIFFIEPKKLFCGLTYTSYKEGVDPFKNGTASYRLGYNCLRDNGLRLKAPSEPVQIIFGGTLASGRRVSTVSEAKVTSNKVTAINNNIQSIEWLKKIANEMQYQKNYSGYEGHITGFLSPYVEPGYKIYLIDNRSPENAGYYMVESTEVVFGMGGARRVIEVGPVLSFKA